jgi:hypothetical protein
VLVWIAGLTLLFALSAFATARDEGLLDLAPMGELGLAYALAAIIVVGSLVWSLIRPASSLPAVAVAGAGIAVAIVLTVTSRQVVEVAVFAGIIAWSWYVGGRILAVLDPEALLSGPPRPAIGFGLGLASLSYAVLLLSLAGLATTLGLLVVLIALPVLVTLPARPRSRDWLSAVRSISGGSLTPVEAAALAFLTAALVASFGVSLSPQVQFDALHYHFAMPRTILDHGRFIERPDIVQSYFPLGLEMVYVPALRFGGESTMTLLHWALAPMAIALVWGAADRFFGRPTGAIAAGLCFLTPLVFMEASSASSDLGMVFWLLAAGLALATYASQPRVRLALMAGVFGGVALTFKLVSATYIVPLAVVFALVLLVQGRRPTALVKPGLAFALGGALLGMPWLLLRWLQTANPVFPMYNNIFRSDKWEPIHERFDLWLYGIGHGGDAVARVWWEITDNPSVFGQEMPAWAVGPAPLAFVAALVALPLLPRTRPLLALLGLAIFFGLSWFFLSQYHRYGLPSFVLMGLLGAVALAFALDRLPGFAGRAVALVVLAVWFVAGLTVGMAMLEPEPYPRHVVLGSETREAYRQRAIPNYDALLFLDSVTRGTEDKAAMLGYKYNYFVANPVYSMLEPPPLSAFARVLESGLSGQALARELEAAGIRWLLVDWHPIFPADWPPRYLAKSVLSQEFLDSYAVPMFEKHNVVVYRIAAD